MVPCIPDDQNSSAVKIKGMVEFLSEQENLKPIFFNPGATYELKMKRGEWIKIDGISHKAETDAEISIQVVKDGRMVQKVLRGKIIPKTDVKTDKK